MYHCIGPAANSLPLLCRVLILYYGHVTRLTPLSHAMALPVVDSCMIYTSEQLSHDVHKSSFDPVNPEPLHSIMAPAGI